MGSIFDEVKRSIAGLSQTTIGYSEGPNHGPPLLLIHGLTVRRESFAPVAAELMKNFHVFAIDQRGHGQSGHPDTGYTLTNYSSDAAEFIEKVIGDNSLIWGHSLGAGTAMVTAHRYPDRVSALIAEDPPILRTSRGIPDDSFIAEILPQWAEYVRRKPTISELEKLLGSNEIIEEMGTEAIRYFAESLAQVDPRTVDAALSSEAISLHHPLDSLLNIQCRSLLMQADPELGGIIPDDFLENLLPLPGNWSLIRYAGHGHEIHISDPVTVARDAIEFFESVG